ncbi:hypothetical protein AAHA92_03309 [Salvia divinorum]|uniref:Uncharacterized protein n=1 Tax=Salvia divinorum TaxID=28513 RepID=A0ABD1IHA2_SALDI
MRGIEFSTIGHGNVVEDDIGELFSWWAVRDSISLPPDPNRTAGFVTVGINPNPTATTSHERIQVRALHLLAKLILLISSRI